MPYHVLSDCQAFLVTLTIDATSRPTATQAQQILDGTEVYVNSVLAQRYTTPITDVSALDLVTIICAKLSAAWIWRTKFYGENPIEYAGSKTYADHLEQWSEGFLERIRQGEDVLHLDPQPPVTEVEGELSEGMAILFADGTEKPSVFEVGEIL